MGERSYVGWMYFKLLHWTGCGHLQTATVIAKKCALVFDADVRLGHADNVTERIERNGKVSQ